MMLEEVENPTPAVDKLSELTCWLSRTSCCRLLALMHESFPVSKALFPNIVPCFYNLVRLYCSKPQMLFLQSSELLQLPTANISVLQLNKVNFSVQCVIFFFYVIKLSASLLCQLL